MTTLGIQDTRRKETKQQQKTKKNIRRKSKMNES
jgi:hypothetical protein